MLLEAIHPASCDAARGIFSHHDVMRTFLLFFTDKPILKTNG
jgi:hypothetical protein